MEQLTEGQAYAELLLATSICVLDAMVFPRIPICTWIFACVTANTAEF